MIGRELQTQSLNRGKNCSPIRRLYARRSIDVDRLNHAPVRVVSIMHPHAKIQRMGAGYCLTVRPLEMAQLFSRQVVGIFLVEKLQLLIEIS